MECNFSFWPSNCIQRTIRVRSKVTLLRGAKSRCAKPIGTEHSRMLHVHSFSSKYLTRFFSKQLTAFRPCTPIAFRSITSWLPSEPQLLSCLSANVPHTTHPSVPYPSFCTPSTSFHLSSRPPFMNVYL